VAVDEDRSAFLDFLAWELPGGMRRRVLPPLGANDARRPVRSRSFGGGSALAVSRRKGILRCAAVLTGGWAADLGQLSSVRG